MYVNIYDIYVRLLSKWNDGVVGDGGDDGGSANDICHSMARVLTETKNCRDVYTQYVDLDRLVRII